MSSHIPPPPAGCGSWEPAPRPLGPRPSFPSWKTKAQSRTGLLKASGRKVVGDKSPLPSVYAGQPLAQSSLLRAPPSGVSCAFSNPHLPCPGELGPPFREVGPWETPRVILAPRKGVPVQTRREGLERERLGDYGAPVGPAPCLYFLGSLLLLLLPRCSFLPLPFSLALYSILPGLPRISKLKETSKSHRNPYFPACSLQTGTKGVTLCLLEMQSPRAPGGLSRSSG